jgi:hypothetical protein
MPERARARDGGPVTPTHLVAIAVLVLFVAGVHLAHALYGRRSPRE